MLLAYSEVDEEELHWEFLSICSSFFVAFVAFASENYKYNICVPLKVIK